MTLEISHKGGKTPKGRYEFIEFYCTDEGCDCRRVLIVVLNSKLQGKAVISMGLDQGTPFSGPFLDDSHPQAPYATELLEFFVHGVNRHPEFLEMIHCHYKNVRTKIDGKKYCGKPFPKPGSVRIIITPPPDVPDELVDMFNEIAEEQKNTLNTRKIGSGQAKGKIPYLQDIFESYLLVMGKKRYRELEQLQNMLRDCLMNNRLFIDELIAMLLQGDRNSEKNDDVTQIETALYILGDTLELLRVDLERNRPGTTGIITRLQKVIAKKIILGDSSAGLCTAITNILMDSRIKLLPILEEANTKRMMRDAEEQNITMMPGVNPAEALFSSLEEMGLESPFDVVEQMLQIIILIPANIQTALLAEMMGAKNRLIRDAGPLMLFHPSTEVRRNVSELVAESAEDISPETLRRLIISRNWFPEGIRANIDRAIASARRGRVECAPLQAIVEAKVYASPVDGAFAQSFQTIVPKGKGFVSCAILLKRGHGVADSFVIELPSKQEMNNFIKEMNEQGAFIESSFDYLDMRVCHALAEGAKLGNSPNCHLINVAEILGRDQWKGVSFDPASALEEMRTALTSSSPALIESKNMKKTIEESGEWLGRYGFTDSWFEDDSELDGVITRSIKKSRKPNDAGWDAVEAILALILEKRRDIWIERTALCALWLRSAKKPPVPWHKMYLLAEALSDRAIPIKEIPLMVAVAFKSLEALLGRSKR